MKRLITQLIALLCLAAPLSTWAATLKAENETLGVYYDEGAHTFSVADKASGKTFLLGGKLEGTDTKAFAQAAADPIFGAGRKIVVTQADESIVTLALYNNLPFLLVSKEQKNPGTAELDVQKAVPATFAVDLGTAPNNVKTMGTGGLLPPDKNPGSYFFLTVADPATRNGVVIGWLTQSRGSGTVFSGINDGMVQIRTQLEHGHLIVPPGQSVKLDTIAIGCFPDARLGLEQFADAVKRQYGIQLRPPVATYCSWYAEGPNHGGAGTPETTVELSKYVAKELKPFGLGVIQIDDRWQAGPQIGGPATEFDRVAPSGPYRSGIEPVAKALNQDGIVLGLWWLPFGRNHMQPEYKDRQNWFFKYADGTPLRQRSFGGTCLDSTHPEVQEHLKTLARTIRGWGVTYFKMDGLSVGAGVDHYYINDGYKNDNLSNCLPPSDRTKSNIEALRLGLQIIRQGAGDDVFFSGCCAVQNMRIYAGSIGLVDSMRVGPDFNHDGEGIRSGPLRGSRMYFLNGRIWWNDPDPSKVRTSNEGCVADSSINGGVTLNQARLTTSWVSLSGQFFLLSDWLPNLPAERVEVLRRTLAHHNATARPVDYFDNALANTWLVTDEQSGVRRDVIGCFNFYANPLNVDHSCAKIGLDPSRKYHAFDFWADTLLPDLHGSFKASIEPNSCRVIAVRAEEGRPVLLSTSRHVTQGIIDVAGEKWTGNSLSASSQVIANDPYELRIRVPDGWEFAKASANYAVSLNDDLVPITVATRQMPGLLRVKFQCPATGRVNWNVSFSKSSKSVPATIASLKADMKDGESPVLLTWEGSAPFYDISRDGVPIATGHYGFSFADAGAPLGSTVTYTVKIAGANSAMTTSLVTKALHPGPVPALPEISLATLTPKSARVGWGSITVGKDVGGTPLILSGKTYSDGIGLHADAEVVYAKPANAKRFVAIVGLDDSQRRDARASIRCSVLSENAAGNMTALGQTPALRSGKLEQWHFDLPLSADAAKIHLLVSDLGDGIACDHADWVNAGFRCD